MFREGKKNSNRYILSSMDVAKGEPVVKGD
jgi:hypothetical protein